MLSSGHENKWQRDVVVAAVASWQLVAVQVVREHGWTGLYRGLQASLLGTAVSQGIYFYFYSQLRQLAVAQQRQTLAAQVGFGC